MPITPAVDPEKGRRNARFTYARRRIQQIVDGSPPLTDEQREQLALILRAGTEAARRAS